MIDRCNIRWKNIGFHVWRVARHVIGSRWCNIVVHRNIQVADTCCYFGHLPALNCVIFRICALLASNLLFDWLREPKRGECDIFR